MRQQFQLVWRTLSACAMLLLLAGIAALFVRVPDGAKLGAAIVLVSAVGTSLLARSENRRFAAPIIPLALILLPITVIGLFACKPQAAPVIEGT